jgi:uncharacterized protein YeaO (DUF488 family)
MKIYTKRVYDPPSRTDGKRYLVDRLWPRGLKREDLQLEDWVKEIAPSNELRKWFGHDPALWDEFRSRYFKELEDNKAALKPLIEAARHDTVTLVYGAKDTTHNNAVAIKEFLEKHT